MAEVFEMSEQKWTPEDDYLVHIRCLGCGEILGPDSDECPNCSFDEEAYVAACRGAPNSIQPGAVKAMAEALERILNAGEWYGSALEIDQYVTDAVDGETLEAMGRAALRLYHGDE